MPENLEACVFLLGLPRTHCQTSSLRIHLVIKDWLSSCLRDVLVMPFCDSLILSFIHCATVYYSSEHRSGSRKFCSLGRKPQIIRPNFFSICIYLERL